MDKKEGLSTNRQPLFDGTQYTFWSIRMKYHILSLNFDIWQSFVDGYTEPISPPNDAASKNICENNEKDKNAILCGLTNPIFTELVHYKSTEEVWDKLQNIY